MSPSSILTYSSLVVLAGLGLLLARALFVVVRFSVYSFLLDETVTFAFAEDGRAPMPEDLVAEPQVFRAADGTPLAGVVVKPRDAREAPRGIVVFAPEFGGDADSWRRYAAFVPRAGYWLFAFDFRATGQSPAVPGYQPRRWCSEREVDDLQGALACARTLAHGSFRNIAIFGISRGGLAGLAAAEQDAEIPGVVLEGTGSTLAVMTMFTEKRLRVVLPECVWAAIPGVAYLLLSRLVRRIAERRVGYRFIEIDELDAPASGGRCLFIHGERDRYVTPAMARRAFARWPGPKDLWMAADARHNGAAAKHPDEYRTRVLAHIESVMDRAAPEARGRDPLLSRGQAVAGAVHADGSVQVPHRGA